MFKSMIALALLSAVSAPLAAQTAPAANSALPAAKPAMVKKRVCEKVEDDNPYSRLGSRTICKTVQVPADQAAGATANGQQAPAQSPQSSTNNM